VDVRERKDGGLTALSVLIPLDADAKFKSSHEWHREGILDITVRDEYACICVSTGPKTCTFRSIADSVVRDSDVNLSINKIDKQTDKVVCSISLKDENVEKSAHLDLRKLDLPSNHPLDHDLIEQFRLMPAGGYLDDKLGALTLE
jgi:hypothetical protein